MNKNKQKQENDTRLFKSGFLEFLTRVPPRVAISYNLLCSAALLTINFRFGFVSSIGVTALWVVTGFFSWTLAEYLLHRFFFHMKSDAKWVKKIAHTMHGIHHDHPNDYSRLFMPPLPATLFMLFFFVSFYLILNVRVFAFLPGFLTGYLAYAYTHFKTHQIRAPKLLKFIWTHHLKHHYQDEDKAFGVSSPFWDLVFRTLPKKAVVRTPKKDESEILEEESTVQD
ncbi:MAG: hypothetical protein S4CHLAM7_00370 [Chlamydiae bacterium]|nr:hypothetical protein [Chlamydiota bacterium]